MYPDTGTGTYYRVHTNSCTVPGTHSYRCTLQYMYRYTHTHTYYLLFHTFKRNLAVVLLQVLVVKSTLGALLVVFFQ